MVKTTLKLDLKHIDWELDSIRYRFSSQLIVKYKET